MVTIVILSLAAIGCTAVAAAVCFIMYLRLLRFVITETGSTEGLADVAKAMSAYKVPLPTRRGRHAR
jgi:hypothetical protein